MRESGKTSPTVSIPVRFGPDSRDRRLTPGRRAIERIKRKAMGLASGLLGSMARRRDRPPCSRCNTDATSRPVELLLDF
jgi:hypothetical protein